MPSGSIKLGESYNPEAASHMYPKHEDHGMEQAGWDVQISFLGGICKLQYLGKPTEICQMLIRRQYLVKSQGSKLVMPRIGRFINGFEEK